MTFIANIVTRNDSNNSCTNYNASSFTGNPSDTGGFNTLIINISKTALNGLLKIQFSSTGTDFSDNSTIFYSDYIFGSSNSNGNIFIKTYPILNKYYRIVFTPIAETTFTINARLSTQSYENGNQNSISAFNNKEENIRDAFGKLRVSNPYTLLDLRVPGQDATGLGTTGSTGYTMNDLQYAWGTTGAGSGGTGYKLCSRSQTDIYVTGENIFTNQSRKYCVYQPGKSLLFMATVILNAGNALNYGSGNTNGMKSRVGYYDDYNGLFFEYDSLGDNGNTGCSIVMRKKAEGTDLLINQQEWNIDKMDGTGNSGLKLDWTKVQLFIIDMEWLGIGRVRFGFYAYGQIQYCHEITHINELDLGPYTYNINLPVRCELEGTTSGQTGAMIQICSTVISEGGYTPIGRPFSINTNVNASTYTSFTPILFLRGGNTLGNYYHQQIIPSDITIISNTANGIGILRLRLFFTVGNVPLGETSTSWSNVDQTYSVAQYGITGSISSGQSITVYESVFAGRSSISFSSLSNVFTELL